jgi:tRNA C32,U32 (ribose-2'-O)-methylase TrmJ
VLLESLQASGYIKPNGRKAAEEKVRRLVRRLSLTPADSELLLGMVRKMLWKMNSTQPGA